MTRQEKARMYLGDDIPTAPISSSKIGQSPMSQLIPLPDRKPRAESEADIEAILKSGSLDTITGEELLNMSFPNQKPLISRLLPRGTFIFAGASKIGKSWLVLWLAHRISTGEPVWDFETAKGEVLW